MSAEIFIRRWLGLAALLAAMIAIAPYFVHVVVANSGCGDAARCGHQAEILGHYARRLTLVVTLLPLLLAVAARTLTTGGVGWAFPTAALMTAGALPLADETHDLTNTGVWTDLASQPAMVPLLFLLLLLVAFSAHPDDEQGGGTAAWRTLLGVVAIAALFVTAPLWAAGLASLPIVGTLAAPAAHAMAMGHEALGIAELLPAFANYCLMAFVLGTAGLLFSGQPQTARPIRTLRA